jgi:hypothetical protein
MEAPVPGARRDAARDRARVVLFVKSLVTRAGIPLAMVAAAAFGPAAWRWVTQDARDWAGKAAPNNEKGPSVLARGVRSVVFKDERGRRAWEFAAESIEISADKRWATLVGVRRAVLFRDAKPYLRMSARHVRFDQQTRDWRAHDDLRVQGPDGLTISSRAAIWNHKAQLLDCPEPVQARLKGADISAPRLRYDAREGKIRTPDQVSMDSPGAAARGSRMTVDVKKRFIETYGADVTIKPPLLEKLGVKR